MKRFLLGSMIILLPVVGICLNNLFISILSLLYAIGLYFLIKKSSRVRNFFRSWLWILIDFNTKFENFLLKE